MIDRPETEQPAHTDLDQGPAPVRRFSRLLGWLLATLLLATVAGEVISRTWLGLGDPPLSIADPEIEYLSKPGTYHRFGNRVFINSHHMRSDEFPARKQSPDEVRVMVLGDSVVHGGGLTDQADLATVRLRDTLREELGRPVVVGNIAAGSWGPGNLLAYAKKFGLFDADAVLIVLHGKDVGDNPTGTPVVGVDPSFPAHRPALALLEAVARYLIPRLRQIFGHGVDHAQPIVERNEQAEADRSMRDLAALCELASGAGAKVILAYVPQRVEINGESLPGHAVIEKFAADHGIEFIDVSDAFRQAAGRGDDPYRPNDSIHPSENGQNVLCDAVLPAIRRAIEHPSTAAP
jgi:hypothetical protein